MPVPLVFEIILTPALSRSTGRRGKLIACYELYACQAK